VATVAQVAQVVMHSLKAVAVLAEALAAQVYFLEETQVLAAQMVAFLAKAVAAAEAAQAVAVAALVC
jgi:hypothetical protein